jgi:hypothetical protein
MYIPTNNLDFFFNFFAEFFCFQSFYLFRSETFVHNKGTGFDKVEKFFDAEVEEVWNILGKCRLRNILYIVKSKP